MHIKHKSNFPSILQVKDAAEPQQQRQPCPPHTGRSDEVKARILEIAEAEHARKMQYMALKEEEARARIRAANNEADYWAVKRRLLDASTGHAVHAPATNRLGTLWQMLDEDPQV